VTRLDKNTFNVLLSLFLPQYQSSMGQSESSGRVHNRKLTAPGCFVLCLHYLAHAPSLCSLCLFTGCVMSTTSRYLSFSLRVMMKVLREVDSASLEIPSVEYLQRLGDLAERVMGHECMRGCIMVIDRSLHALEKDAEANSNFFYDESHPDYNGWKGCYCRKGLLSLPFMNTPYLIGLYFFLLDGTIVWSAIECPGSWSNAYILDRARDFISSLPFGLWIL